jgi:hypothetical protein
MCDLGAPRGELAPRLQLFSVRRGGLSPDALLVDLASGQPSAEPIRPRWEQKPLSALPGIPRSVTRLSVHLSGGRPLLLTPRDGAGLDAVQRATT